jgi:hypothetical protein
MHESLQSKVGAIFFFFQDKFITQVMRIAGCTAKYYD